jgi:stage II sporulation protein D
MATEFMQARLRRPSADRFTFPEMRTRVAATIAVLAAVTAGTARASTTLIVTGHGWGHGVGMSQYGAYGYALHGWKYKRILYHYYPGTTLTRGGEPNVRVLLAQATKVATIGCATQITVSDGRRFKAHLPAGTYGVGPRLALPIHHRKGVRPFARGFADFSCPRAPLTLGGRPYHGDLVVRSNGSTLSVINALELDEYVRGVVPSESPARWPIAELEAQAVAARSYAVAQLKPGAQYDLVPTTADQVYGGMAAQRPRSNRAVRKTLGQILTFGGKVARTYYSSSSGGETESVQDAWPGAAPIPYLRSVSDPWDTYSPNHNWGPFVYSADQLATRLGLAGSVESARVRQNSSLRAASVGLRLSSGKTVSLSGTGVARTLGLKSTWFSIGALSVTTNVRRVLYGNAVKVVARVREAKGAVLQEQSPDGVWRTLRHVHDKSVLSLEPRASAAFRLRIPGASGASVGVAVRPRLQVKPLGPRLLGGEVLPRIAGPVKVWRLERGAWHVVSRPRILSSGKFQTRLRLRPTVYRITAGDGAFAPVLRRLVVTRSMLASLRQ